MAIGIAVLLVMSVHLAVGIQAPLWFDESWTGALASLPTLGELVHHIQEEVGGPVYYVFIWLWARAFGVSDVSLHSASLLLDLSAPVLAWIGLRRSRPQLAIAWAVLLATWGPGMAQSGYARCYPLLLCSVVITTVLYIRLLQRPSLRRSCIWAGSAAVTVLTHYDSIILVAVQGLMFIAAQRRHALSMWPAALLFIPALAWIIGSVYRLALVSSPGVTWYRVVTWQDLPSLLAYMIGLNFQLVPLAMGCALILSIAILTRGGSGLRHLRQDQAIAWTCVSGLVAIGLFIGVAMLRPVLSLRYLTAFEPGLALSMSHWLLGASSGSRARLGILLLASVAISSLYWIGPLPMPERDYNFETASRWIAESTPSRMTFFWDAPTASVVAEDQMGLVGGFFLHRAGLRTRIDPLYPEAGVDMNTKVGERLGEDGSLIWIYNNQQSDATAFTHPPKAELYDRRIECRNFGQSTAGVFACRPKTPGET